MEKPNAAALSNLDRLKNSDYPGRGIALGMTPSGKEAVQIYWTMGRSESSKNRVLLKQGDCVKVVPFDKSKELRREDLIIYNAAMRAGGAYIVSNGRQTDAVADSLAGGGSFEGALYPWSFEDDPMCTPRIAGLTAVDPEARTAGVKLSVIKAVGQDPVLPAHQFFAYKGCLPGLGWCVHTYSLTEACAPFDGEPYPVTVCETVAENAELYWSLLSPDKRVGLYVRHINLSTGAAADAVKNQLQGAV